MQCHIQEISKCTTWTCRWHINQQVCGLIITEQVHEGNRIRRKSNLSSRSETLKHVTKLRRNWKQRAARHKCIFSSKRRSLPPPIYQQPGELSHRIDHSTTIMLLATTSVMGFWIKCVLSNHFHLRICIGRSKERFNYSLLTKERWVKKAVSVYLESGVPKTTTWHHPLPHQPHLRNQPQHPLYTQAHSHIQTHYPNSQ